VAPSVLGIHHIPDSADTSSRCAPQAPPETRLEALRGAALQRGGFVLSTTAVVGTVLTYDQDDEMMIWKILAWCLLACVGLILHELRPFQRPQR
jgi:hypothetical protein